MKVTKALLDTNQSRFIIQNMSTDKIIEKAVNSDVKIQISETTFSELKDAEIEKDNRIHSQETDPDFYPNQTKEIRYESENIRVERGIVNITPGADTEEVIKEFQELLFHDDNKFTEAAAIAKTISQKFRFSTQDGAYAEALHDYYKRQGIFADITGGGTIDGRSKSGSGVNTYDSRTSTKGDLRFKNTSRGFKSSLTKAGEFSVNALSRTLTPKELAEDFFKDNLHTFYDADNTAYNKARKTYIGHNMNAFEFRDFEIVMGEYFRAADFQESKQFIIALVKEARDGVDGPARADRRIFVQKFFRQGGANLDQFNTDFLFSTGGINDSSFPFHTIIDYYKSKR
jgi:rRNA-processing protein FCF1